MRVLALAHDHAGVIPMLGLHPWFVAEAGSGWLARLTTRVTCIHAGIGECGLDFSPGRPDRAAQEAAFEAQLVLAVRLDRPISIHCVRAWERLVAILRRVGVPGAGAVLHAFSGSLEVAAKLQDLGMYLGFNGAVARPGARRGPAALAAVASDRLLLETDAPFGPGDLGSVLAVAAGIRNVAPELLAAQTTDNALRVFGRLT